MIVAGVLIVLVIAVCRIPILGQYAPFARVFERRERLIIRKIVGLFPLLSKLWKPPW